MTDTGILGISIMAAMKKPRASVVSKMPWSDGKMAASRVMVKMAAAGGREDNPRQRPFYYQLTTLLLFR